MKIIKNQYFFFILLSALLLILGISFVISECKIGSDAGTRTFQVNYYARWKNPDGTTSYGKYINTSGDEIDESCGSITVSVTKNSGSHSDCSVSGDGSETNTLSNCVTVYAYTSSIVGRDYNFSIAGSGSSATGFSHSWENNYVGVDVSGDAPLFNETKTYGYTCVFSPNSSTIYYYVNGGIWSDGTTTADEQSTYRFERYSVPSNPSRTGYTFVGFKTDSSGGTEITSSSIFKGDTSIYANWTANTYNITFNKQSGSGGTSSTTATYNSTVPDINVPSRTGYKFQGYYTSTNGNGTKYYDKNGNGLVVYKTTSDITLYAYWIPIEYEVQFNANGGSGTMAKQDFTYGVSQKLTINNFTYERSGHCFAGWKKSSSGTSWSYSNGQSVKNLTSTDGATVNLYVHWKKETYNLIYYETIEDFESGPAARSQTVTFNDSYTFPIINRTGYIFQGWIIGQNSDSTVDSAFAYSRIFNRNQTIKIPDFGNDGKDDITIDVPVIALWSPIKYNVQFDANGGSGSMSAVERTFDGSAVSLPENTFSREGYNFVGWSTNNSLSGITSVDSSWLSAIKRESWFRGEQTIYTNGGNKGRYTIDPTITTSTYYQGNDIYFATGSDEDPGIVWITTGNEDLGAFHSIINSQGDVLTLYAIWEAVDYQIVFDGNGATDGSMSNLAMIYDVSKTLTNFSYTKDGYLFLGWHRVKDATTPEYLNKQSVKNIQLYDEESKTYRTVVEGDKVKLYAVWKETWAINNEKPNGSGTVADPYLIASAENLAWISWIYETGATFDNSNLTPYFLQTANIDLSVYEWLPIADSTNPFGGTYDGNGYVIKNIQTYLIPNVTRAQIGLFGFSNAGTIKNVRLFGDVKGNTNVGGILGMGQYVTFENCTNFSTITATQNAGGIAGFVHGGTYLGCYNYGDISATNIAGGIVARFSDSTILNCYVNATINGANSAGLASYDQGSTKTLISSCAFEGNCGYGAIVGYSASTNTKISNCFANCSITDDSVNYGLCTGTATIESCVFEINGVKRCLGNDFSAWVISSDGRPLPSGLSWLAIGGTKVTNISQITVNYTKVG